MFLGYYGLQDQPFGVTPDPRYLYFSPSHREALGSLFYGIETGCGFMVLVAPPGLGKTTLLAHLLDKLRCSAQTAFLFHTQCDSRDFISQLLIDLGVDEGFERMSEMYETLHSVLLENARCRKRVVLVIDEAQNLADSVFETVRLLSDFETPQAKLMQIVLCGQPQLAERLTRPGLIQLRQRISIVTKLAPLTPAEALGYIDYRLKIAGHAGDALFSVAALQEITAHSVGIPRNINNICFNALTLGHAKRQSQIDESIVREVVADLDLDALSSNSLWPPMLGFDSLPNCLNGGLPADLRKAQGGGVNRSLEETFPQTAIAARSGKAALPVAAETAAAAKAIVPDAALPAASQKSVPRELQRQQTLRRAAEAKGFGLSTPALRGVREMAPPVERPLNRPAAEQEIPALLNMHLDSQALAASRMPQNQPAPPPEKRGEDSGLGLTEALAAFYSASQASRLVGDRPPLPKEMARSIEAN